LRARRERPRSRHATEKGDDLAPFQLIELHFGPTSQAQSQHIELARISQEVSKRFYNNPDNADAAIDRAAHDFISQVPRLHGCYDQRLSLITPKWRKR
jgi:hypothetical protein